MNVTFYGFLLALISSTNTDEYIVAFIRRIMRHQFKMWRKMEKKCQWIDTNDRVRSHSDLILSCWHTQLHRSSIQLFLTVACGTPCSTCFYVLTVLANVRQFQPQIIPKCIRSTRFLQESKLCKPPLPYKKHATFVTAIKLFFPNSSKNVAYF